MILSVGWIERDKYANALVERFKVDKQTVFSKEFIKQTLVDNRKTLRKYGVKRIGLFGSYVRGTAIPASDIDFLVELERLTFDDYMGLTLFLEDLFQKNVDLVTLPLLNRVSSLISKKRWNMSRNYDLYLQDIVAAAD